MNTDFPTEVDRLTQERLAKFAAQSPIEIATAIMVMASSAGKRDDIRNDVSELAFHLVERLGGEA